VAAGHEYGCVFIMLNKSEKDYSPTGKRYIHHEGIGSKVVICVREFKNDVPGAEPYSMLGLCDFVKYEGQADEYHIETHKTDTDEVCEEDREVGGVRSVHRCLC